MESNLNEITEQDLEKLAITHFFKKDYSSAIDLLTELIKSESDWVTQNKYKYYNVIGNSHIKLGFKEKALEFYLLAVESLPVSLENPEEVESLQAKLLKKIGKLQYESEKHYKPLPGKQIYPVAGSMPPGFPIPGRKK